MEAKERVFKVIEEIKKSDLTEKRKALLKEFLWLDYGKNEIDNIIFFREHEVPADVIELLGSQFNYVRHEELRNRLTKEEKDILYK